jgi:hypothetical protein
MPKKSLRTLRLPSALYCVALFLGTFFLFPILGCGTDGQAQADLGQQTDGPLTDDKACTDWWGWQNQIDRSFPNFICQATCGTVSGTNAPMRTLTCVGGTTPGCGCGVQRSKDHTDIVTTKCDVTIDITGFDPCKEAFTTGCCNPTASN